MKTNKTQHISLCTRLFRWPVPPHMGAPLLATAGKGVTLRPRNLSARQVIAALAPHIRRKRTGVATPGVLFPRLALLPPLSLFMPSIQKRAWNPTAAVGDLHTSTARVPCQKPCSTAGAAGP